MTASVSVRHNFETGHRLPVLGGKCENLHGHSWWVEVTVEAPGNPTTVVEFGAFKREVRAWIDEHLDHGLMLGTEDPLTGLLRPAGKVFTFGAERLASDLAWPTVENVARLLSRVAEEALVSLVRAPGAQVVSVKVNETHVNAATWRGEG
jgi:6-pyruvoyltetrahydropterin/6-carboxytetrahydropterin synthase